MITLYINPLCPYCKHTLEFAHELNIPVEVKDKNDEGIPEEVEKLGGKQQYPFMVDAEHDVKMYESEDIMEYFKTIEGHVS